MAVRTINEILESVKSRVGDSTEDTDIEFIEDVSDTLNDLTSKASGQEYWKAKYEENDKAWREKYKERFFSTEENEKDELEDNKDIEMKDKKPKTFADLFNEKE
nr:MAG TPA: hypothetical protein [Caudoviricetes sp.]